MEAPKLETVPEETEAQPVSRPTNKHITSDVPKTVPATEKHPGRVASGKRLAERNRLAREAKKQAKAASTLQALTQAPNQPPRQAAPAATAAATPMATPFLPLAVCLSPPWGCITNAKPL